MKIVRRVLQEFRNFLFEVRARTSSIKDHVQYDTPFVCQFAKPEHAELSLKKELSPRDDPHWADTGATSAERYAEWAFTMCGMASAAMALGYFHGKNLKPAEMAEDALKAGVYRNESDGLSGMRFREFSNWVKKHGLKAEVYTRLSIKGIQYALSEGKLVMVSVNPNVRGYRTAPEKQKGGHLVLVTGYDPNTISINNPSGFVSTATQVNHRLTLEEFRHYYAGRGILLSPTK
ncbi:MAG TPA: C39 family peptidase [Candidatus Paceibacterota bacterium]|jgi:uncharacterized protein YvpB